ncbi:MAG: NAD-dependent epimerase/dehydratase family protein [Nitriliruptorales bacterium]|nr:NAD-dependent epimerase/dehydratase family protein [Nitriliruptorales bacterium]
MTRRRRALITGITGQDGSYLCEHLLARDYEVHGTVRPGRDPSTSALGPLLRAGEPGLRVHAVDLTDGDGLTQLVETTAPHEVYNLASLSHVGTSFAEPVHSGEVTGLGVVRLLDAIMRTDPSIRFCQAGSSEMFGAHPPPQSERTPFHPRSPYAAAKVYGHWTTVNYREAYGLHASNGILFAHESPRRGPAFVTRKITTAIPRVLNGEQRRLKLGNLNISRDWGHARDYVEALHRLLSHPEPLDVAIGTGESHTLEEFLDAAFSHVGLDWHDHVEIDPRLYRPADIPAVRCDATMAREVLGWTPRTSFAQLVEEMVRADLATPASRRAR